MMWVEDELMKLQQMEASIGKQMGNARFAELYRLARLGLAAETRREAFEVATKCTPGQVTAKLLGFLDHPAWRKE